MNAERWTDMMRNPDYWQRWPILINSGFREVVLIYPKDMTHDECEFLIRILRLTQAHSVFGPPEPEPVSGGLGLATKERGAVGEGETDVG